VPWSESRNDDARNGMALCGLHHWTFDQGLVGVTEGYRVQVSPVVPVEEKGAQPILRLAEQGLHLPAERSLQPARRALRWHPEHVLRGERRARLF